MHKIKNATASVKEFVNHHKVVIGVTTTAVVCLMLNRFAMKGYDEFLKEKGLYDEYWDPERE